MKTRIISACFMLPLLAFLYIGGKALLLLMLVISAIGIAEFYNAFENIDVHASWPVGYIALVILYGLIYVSYFVQDSPQLYYQYIGFWFFLTFVAAMLIVLFSEEHNPLDGLITVFGVFYVGFFLAHIVFMDQFPERRDLVWMCLFTALVTDIFAYFGGYLFGKHKLAPIISPKKTVEGAIVGVVGCTVFCLLCGFLYPEVSTFECLFMGVIGSLAGQAGDLTASAFKRKTGIKDYGNLIPGHGGVLDRFDSVIFTIPFIYYTSLICFTLGY